ncbi:MAG: hypothetical protein ACRDA5_12770 [Clostridium sp.]
MKINSKKILLLSSILSSLLFIGGCSDAVETSSEKIILNKGAVTREENGSYTNYNLAEGRYSKLEMGKIIVAYDIVSGNYIYEENSKIFVQVDNKSIEVIDENIVELKISPGGHYISYFKKDKYMELVLIKLKDNEKIELKTEVAISGDLMDWSNENKIVYYGVDNSKNNAIFSYDLETGKEEIIYKLENGYLEFIKSSIEGVIFVQESVGGVKSLKSIDKQNNVKLITDEISDLKDILVTKKGTFILGKANDNNNSIYEVKGNKIERLIYDFPNIIHLEKGLSCDEDGNILFIGGTDSFDKENIYVFDNGYVKALSNEELKYYFVDIE